MRCTANPGGAGGDTPAAAAPAAAPVDPIDALINDGRFQQNQQPMASDIDRAKIDAMQMPNTDAQMQELAAQFPNVSAEDLQAHIRDMQERKARSTVYRMKNPVRKPITVPNKHFRKFVDMIFNEFGDLFHKADPHEVGSIVMGLYLDKMVR
jgi:hypothetical protein